MEHEVLVRDVLPYIEIWTGFIIAILLLVTYHIWSLGKQHPEIFQPDTTAEDKQMRRQKAELRRQYNNQTIKALSLSFVWMIGMIIICFGFNSQSLTNQAWFILVVLSGGLLLMILLIHQKPKM